MSLFAPPGGLVFILQVIIKPVRHTHTHKTNLFFPPVLCFPEILEGLSYLDRSTGLFISRGHTCCPSRSAKGPLLTQSYTIFSWFFLYTGNNHPDGGGPVRVKNLTHRPQVWPLDPGPRSRSPERLTGHRTTPGFKNQLRSPVRFDLVTITGVCPRDCRLCLVTLSQFFSLLPAIEWCPTWLNWRDWFRS